MKIKKVEDLYDFPPSSQQDIMLWVSEEATTKKDLWSLCFKTLSPEGSLLVVCGPWQLSPVYKSLKEAGFEDFELNVWAYKGKEPQKPVFTGWEEWANWFNPSWRPILISRKKSGKANHRACILSFYQKVLGEKTLAENLSYWNTGFLRVRKKSDLLADCFMVHSRDCTENSCGPCCPISAMDMNRKNLSPSSLFSHIPWKEEALFDLLTEITSVEGGEIYTSNDVSKADFQEFPDSFFHSLLAQGNPEGFVPEICRVLRPGGFYVRISSASDPIGVLEDCSLDQGLFLRGRVPLIFKEGCCFYTSSNRGFVELADLVSLSKSSVVVKSKITSFEVKEIEPRNRGGICAMFGS